MNSTVVITHKPESIWQHANPLHMARNLWSQRDLLRQFTKREVMGRYKGSYLGILWSFLTPFLMLAVYTFVFSVVFRARWGNSSSESRVEFALTLFCGLIAFNVFSECISFYPISAVPPFFQLVLRLNPLSAVVEDFRRVIMWSQSSDWPWWGVATIVSALAMVAGYTWFMKLKRAFADVV